jgi:sarcosine oxidase subunit alpha
MVSQKKDFIGKRSLEKNAYVDPLRQTLVGLVPVDKKN